MNCILVVLILTVGIDTKVAPSVSKLTEDIVSSRQRIETLHVRTTSERKLPSRVVNVKTMYLDAPAHRWRVDSTGLTKDADNKGVDAPPVPLFINSVANDLVYRYIPPDPEVVATIDSMKRPVNPNVIHPFPDPRNAGLGHTFQGNSGVPFQSGGAKLPIDSRSITPDDSSMAKVVRVLWKGINAWNVSWGGKIEGEEHERQYTVVPEWGNSVVFLESKFRTTDTPSKEYVFSVETEVSAVGQDGIWFPSKTHFVARLNGTPIQEETTKLEVIGINQPIAEETFTFKGMGVPVGHKVINLIDSSEMTWNGKEVVRSVPLQASSDHLESVPQRRWVLIATSGILLCLSIAVWLKGQRGRASGSVT